MKKKRSEMTKREYIAYLWEVNIQYTSKKECAKMIMRRLDVPYDTVRNAVRLAGLWD